MRRAVAVLALALLASGTGATQAAAQEDGVYFDDPDSPGGKEYSIPHERTRRESGSGGNPGSTGETPRFGVGIEPGEGGGDDGSSGATGGGASGGGGSGGDGDSGRSAAGGGATGEGSGGTSGGGSGAESGRVPYNATSSSDTDPELTVSAIALGVLLAGAGLGLLLRRSRRDPST